MNYEFNLLQHVGVVAKAGVSQCPAAAEMWRHTKGTTIPLRTQQVIALTRIFVNIFTLTYDLDLGLKKILDGFNVCMNYEFNLLQHVGVVAKAGVSQCAAVAETWWHTKGTTIPLRAQPAEG